MLYKIISFLYKDSVIYICFKLKINIKKGIFNTILKNISFFNNSLKHFLNPLTKGLIKSF